MGAPVLIDEQLPALVQLAPELCAVEYLEEGFAQLGGNELLLAGRTLRLDSDRVLDAWSAEELGALRASDHLLWYLEAKRTLEVLD